MPELPEVETTRRGLVALICGYQIESIDIFTTNLRHPIAGDALRKLIGSSFTDIRRRGKYLIIDSSHHSHSLLVHLGMSGSMRVIAASAPRGKHEHIIINLNNNKQLRYQDPRRFGVFKLIDRHAPPQSLLKLGVEPLTTDFDWQYLYKITRRHRSAIKKIIMDQRHIVGVGNIYATEALFDAAIRPDRPSCSLNERECAALHAAICNNLRAAIAMGGSSLRDFSHADGSAGYFQQTLRAYGRADKNCPNCANLLLSVTIAGRASVYCANCQF